MRAAFTNAKLVRRSDLELAANGTLELMGPALPPGPDAPLTLKGALTATQAQLRIPERLPGSVARIDVIEINGTEAPAGRGRDTRASVIPVNLDIAVAIDKPARVSGRGLDSLWTGKLNIGGTAEKPRLAGALTSQRGTLDFAGKSFTLSKGKVDFLDRQPIDPDLDIALDYARNSFKATVTARGRSSAPAIALGSTPELPRDEIMSRILFDKGVGELSALEAVQLANALAQLSGTGIGFAGGGVFNALQETLGLDVLRVETAQSGAATVSAGKYIRKGVYLGVEQGVSATDSSVKVEIEVTPQISIDTRIGQNASGDVGVNWKWDY